MFLNFEVPKKTERHGTTTVTTFIGGPEGRPGSNLIGRVFTIDEAFIAAGGFGKKFLIKRFLKVNSNGSCSSST
jgi:hypothetical protein